MALADLAADGVHTIEVWENPYPERAVHFFDLPYDIVGRHCARPA